MPWSFDKATRADVDELMGWFRDAQSTKIWGGPKFRYPFTKRTFYKDCRWREFSSFSLRNPSGDFVAFGQLGSRYERSHLARLVVHPNIRGEGIGQRLIKQLIDTTKREYESTECGLFVYRDNVPAYRCYLSLGFKVREYPERAPMRDQCFYLTKVI